MKITRLILMACSCVLLAASVASAASWQWLDAAPGVPWADNSTPPALSYITTATSAAASGSATEEAVDDEVKDSQYNLSLSRTLEVTSGSVWLTVNSGVTGIVHTTPNLGDPDGFAYSEAGVSLAVSLDGGNFFSGFYYGEDGGGVSIDDTDISSFLLGVGLYDIEMFASVFAHVDTAYGGYASAHAGLDSFWVQASVEPTPIPGAVWLLGSGLAGLFGLRRKLNF